MPKFKAYGFLVKGLSVLTFKSGVRSLEQVRTASTRTSLCSLDKKWSAQCRTNCVSECPEKSNLTGKPQNLLLHCPKDQALGNSGGPEKNYQLCRVPQSEGLNGHGRTQKKKPLQWEISKLVFSVHFVQQTPPLTPTLKSPILLIKNLKRANAEEEEEWVFGVDFCKIPHRRPTCWRSFSQGN
jgi:hypothetical protein